VAAYVSLTSEILERSRCTTGQTGSVEEWGPESVASAAPASVFKRANGIVLDVTTGLRRSRPVEADRVAELAGSIGADGDTADPTEVREGGFCWP